MILVDASVWTDFLAGRGTPHRPILRQLIEKEEDICITEIILTEILQGIKDDDVYETTKLYLLEFPIIRPKGIETYLAAAEIFRKCRKHGRTVRKTVDCIISAIAQENGFTLFHNDNDFAIIEKCIGLKTLKP
jgi:hypothetical protein